MNFFNHSLFTVCCLLSLGLTMTACKQDSNKNTQSVNAEAPKFETTKISNPNGDIQLMHFKNMMLDGFASAETQDQIRNCFADFKTAVSQYQGQIAADMMSASSLEYYQNILLSAKMRLYKPENYNRFEKGLPYTARIMARLLTDRLSQKYIESATPHQLFVTGFNQGWIGYKSLSSASLDNITAYHNDEVQYYVADFYYDETIKDKSIIHIGFVFENKQCKIDLIPLFGGIDQLIEKDIKENKKDPNKLIEETVQMANDALQPDNWPEYISERDDFVAYFPRKPVTDFNQKENIYTSSHHLYGQFDVRVKYYSGEDTPYTSKKARDHEIMDLLVPLESEKPLCVSGMVDTVPLIKCDFVIPSRDSKGKAVWVFDKTRQYVLFNLARTSQYNDNAAATFIEKFSFNKKPQP